MAEQNINRNGKKLTQIHLKSQSVLYITFAYKHVQQLHLYNKTKQNQGFSETETKHLKDNLVLS